MPPEPAKKATLPQFVAKLEPTNFPSREGGNGRAHTARRCAKFARDEVRPRKVTGCKAARAYALSQAEELVIVANRARGVVLS
jgi:hypothetical protein